MPDPKQPHLPPSPEDDAARADAVKTIARKSALWGIPGVAIAVLCLLLGVPWWIVAIGIGAVAFTILFDI